VLFVVGLAAALWSASGYIAAFMRASNVVWDVHAPRARTKHRPARSPLAEGEAPRPSEQLDRLDQTRRYSVADDQLEHPGQHRRAAHLDLLPGPPVRSFAAVGKPSTPTPTGQFFVEETVIMPVSEPGGPFALATSARSNVLQEFDGGPGQIAIHGRDGLGGTPGQAESHGCMRITTPNIDWLASRIGPGTPVTIK
jgi:L,D-transpeptidase catalytic domain